MQHGDMDKKKPNNSVRFSSSNPFACSNYLCMVRLN
jgi:hypothetical protein